MNSEGKFDGFPLILGWELTLACNLRCGHCGTTAGIPREKELNTEEALALCDQFPQMLVQEVDFTGGEPLLRHDWALLAECLRDYGIMVKIVTNGTLLNADNIALIKKAEIAGIGVSIDGLAHTHDAIRKRPGLYQLIVPSIKMAIREGLSLTAITSVNALNLSELPDMMHNLLEMGVRNWRLQPIFPLGRAQLTDDLQLSETDFLKFGEFYVKWRSHAEAAGLVIRAGDAYGYFTKLDTDYPPWRGCPAGLFACGVTSNGKIKGCLSMPDELVEGDLRQNDFWDIWFSPNSFKYNRVFSQDSLGFNCEGCKKASQCRGGCATMSFGSTGQFHNNPYCFQGIKSRQANIKVQRSGTKSQ